MKKIRKLIAWILAVSVVLCASAVYPAQEAKAATGSKLVAFTFDDGPSANTAALLDGLRQRGAKATFFMSGSNGGAGVIHWSSLLNRMISEGHQLANHTYSHHVPFSGLSAASMRSEVSGVETWLFRAMGGNYQDMVRIPGGDRSGLIDQSVSAPMILWSVDTLDWKYRNTAAVYNNIMSSVRDGSIVLLHDLYATSVQAALQAISALQSQGYECVTVAELLRRRGITPVNGETYSHVYPNGVNLPAYTAPAVSFHSDAGGTLQVRASSPDAGLSYYFTTDGSMPNLGSFRCGTHGAADGQTVTVVGIDRFGTRTPVTVVVAKTDNPFGIAFNAAYYANHYPDVKQAFGANESMLLAHFKDYGIKEGRVASPVFSINYYMDQNADLKAAYGNDRMKYVQHFLQYGMKEGRSASATFDVFAYRNRNADLQSVYGADLAKYYEHFVNYGYQEGRKGDSFGLTFDAVYYANQYPDLKKVMGTDEEQLMNHFKIYGLKEGRTASPVFSVTYYMKQYGDLKKSFGADYMKYIAHFQEYGMKEGRMAIAGFDVRSYRNLYSDLRVAFGTDLTYYYAHYVQNGYREKRKTAGASKITDPITAYNGKNYSAVYDFNYYTNRYSDVKAKYTNDDVAALEHFVKDGMGAGSQASAEFNVQKYKARYADLQAAFGDDLKQYYLHYMEYGKKEGRNAK